MPSIIIVNDDLTINRRYYIYVKTGSISDTELVPTYEGNSVYLGMKNSNGYYIGLIPDILNNPTEFQLIKCEDIGTSLGGGFHNEDIN
jgi:hypothetical protein